MYYKKLRKIRMKKKYTTADMADLLGISKPFYSQIENKNRRLSYEMAFKISKILNTKPDMLFYDEFLMNETKE